MTAQNELDGYAALETALDELHERWRKRARNARAQATRYWSEGDLANAEKQKMRYAAWSKAAGELEQARREAGE